jgi:hypothetical protein
LTTGSFILPVNADVLLPAIAGLFYYWALPACYPPDIAGAGLSESRLFSLF